MPEQTYVPSPFLKYKNTTQLPETLPPALDRFSNKHELGLIELMPDLRKADNTKIFNTPPPRQIPSNVFYHE